MQCAVVFEQPSSFLSECSKVAYVTSLLTSKAKLWATIEWEYQLAICSSFVTFSGEFWKVFDTSCPQKDAGMYLFETVQGHQSVAEFTVDFHTATAVRGWNLTPPYSAFYQILAADIKDELDTQELPTKLDDLISMATWEREHLMMLLAT